MKIYHAHGYAVKQKEIHGIDTEWAGDSAFAEVFFDFDEAKRFLIDNFEKLLKDIYSHDCRFACSPPEYGDITKSGECWRREYIDEYIDYLLLITEIHTDNIDAAKIDFAAPPRIIHYLRYNGEERTRSYVFGDKEYECRESDLLPEAGTKFKVGDLVRYTDWEFGSDFRDVMIVLERPKKPNGANGPWENHYELLNLNNYVDRNVRVEAVDLHEADLALYDEELLGCYHYKDEILFLQRIVTGELQISRELKEQILGGKISFDKRPSWREIPELNRKWEVII